MRDIDSILDALERLNVASRRELPRHLADRLADMGIVEFRGASITSLIDRVFTLQGQIVGGGADRDDDEDDGDSSVTDLAGRPVSAVFPSGSRSVPSPFRAGRPAAEANLRRQ
jgi:hypothetical protein